MMVIIAGFTLFNVVVTVLGLSAANRAAAPHNATRELRDDAHKAAGLIIGAFDSYRQGATEAIRDRRRGDSEQRCRATVIAAPLDAIMGPGAVCVRPVGHVPPHADEPLPGDLYPPCEHRPDARQDNRAPCMQGEGRSA